jgi:hypothetical protein
VYIIFCRTKLKMKKSIQLYIGRVYYVIMKILWHQ